MHHVPEDRADMIPDGRRRKVAAILARGILRLQCMRQVEPAPAAAGAAEPAESEAGEAYIASQRGEGWSCLPDR